MAYQYAPQYSVVPAAAPAQTFTAAPTYDPNAFTAAAPIATYAPAQYVTAAPAQYATYTPNRDEIRTIFVTGFPMDVRERELTNMCRFMQGYEVRRLQFRWLAMTIALSCSALSPGRVRRLLR
jgi:hypothetical protein